MRFFVFIILYLHSKSLVIWGEEMIIEINAICLHKIHSRCDTTSNFYAARYVARYFLSYWQPPRYFFFFFFFSYYVSLFHIYVKSAFFAPHKVKYAALSARFQGNSPLRLVYCPETHLVKPSWPTYDKTIVRVSQQGKSPISGVTQEKFILLCDTGTRRRNVHLKYNEQKVWVYLYL